MIDKAAFRIAAKALEDARAPEDEGEIDIDFATETVIEAYLAAAPLPGAPVAWTSKSEIDDVATKQRLTALFVSPVVNDSYKIPLYTAAPDAAQAVAAIADIAKQKLSTEIDVEDYDDADWEGGYDACIIRARGAKP